MSRTRFAALLLVLGTLAVYLPVSHYGFSLYDDPDYVSENSIVQDGLTPAGIKWAFTTWHASNWHPVTWLSHMLDCQLFGSGAGFHHVVSVLFHTINAVLLLILLARLTGAFWPSAVVAALFAWHPLHVESVVWISERKDVLSTFFGLLTLLCYARFAQTVEDKNAKAKQFYVPALVFFALGLMSKPMLVTLPFVMLLLDYWPLQRINRSTFRRLLIEKIPFFLLVAASCALTFLAQQQGGAVVSLQKISLASRLENAPVAVVRYLFKLFWPEHLAVIYPLEKFSALVVGMSLAVLIFVSAVAWLLRQHRPYWIIGWLWFLGMLVPVIGLVQVGAASMADRYTYLPSVGIFLAVTFGIRDLAGRWPFHKTIIAPAAGTALAICLFLTHRQLGYWRDDVALFSHAIAVTKNNDIAHLNLGYAFEKTGQNTDAMNEFRAALNINPDNVQAHNNLANLLDDAGHPDEALAEFQTALRLRPDYSAARCNLGTLYVELGRFDEAMQQYAEAAKLDPADWHPPYLAGKALLKQGRDTEAVSFFQQALRNDSNNPHLLTFVAQVLASDENPAVRDGDTAFRLAQKADDLTGGIQPAVLDALAMAQAELGRFDNAQTTASKAIEIASRTGVTNNVPLIQQHLEFYKKNQPFHQAFTNAPVKELPK